MRIYSRLYLEAFTLHYPTSNGQNLRFVPDDKFKRINYSFELTRLPAETDTMPVDAIECRIWIPDFDGHVWTTATRCTAEFFLDELALAQFEHRFGYCVFDDAHVSRRELFDSSMILQDVAFSTDYRIYHSIQIRNQRVHVSFKYALFKFDVAVRITENPRPDLLIRLHAGPDYDPKQPLGDSTSWYLLPALLYELDGPERIFRRTGAFINDIGSWEDPPFPVPVIFEPTDERGEAQETVRVD